MTSSGTLFLLPTPLSNSDPAQILSAGALQVARAATYVLAENARSARAFLKAAGHPGPIQQVQIVQIGHDPQPAQARQWLQPLRDGGEAALVSECGCPAVADPGATVVACAHDMGLRVRPLVGPSSILLALMASGFNGQRFCFHGYLPQQVGALADDLRRLDRDAARGETQIFIETPYRTHRLFLAILEHCNSATRFCVALDLGSALETVLTRSIAQWRGIAQSALPDLHRRPAVFLLCSGLAA